MIQCDKPTGESCSADTPCCDNTIEPTLKTLDYLTYRSDAFLDAIKKLGDEPARSLLRRVEKSFPANNPFCMNPWFYPGASPIANSCGILGGWQYSNARDYVAGPGDAYNKYKNHTGLGLNDVPPQPNMPIPAGTKGTAVLHCDIDKRMQEARGESYRTNDNSN